MNNSQARVANLGNVVVLIPHYNDIPGLDRALASLATENVAVIVVDDGSSMPPGEDALRHKHPYIKELRIIKLAENIGIARALNAGLAYASDYDYIARLDCGDESLPGRIRHQTAYLDEHDDCHLIGSWAEYVDESSGLHQIRRYPCRHQDIRLTMYRCNVFCHSAAMFRRTTALSLGGYPISYQAAEDYALFFSMAQRYQVTNIPAIYARHFLSERSISALQGKAQILSSIKLLFKHMRPGYIAPALQGIAVASARLLLGVKATASLKHAVYPQADGGHGSYSGRSLQVLGKSHL